MNRGGFRAQIEILGEIFEYNFDKPVRKNISIANIFIKDGKATIKHELPCSTSSKKAWELDTKSYPESIYNNAFS